MCLLKNRLHAFSRGFLNNTNVSKTTFEVKPSSALKTKTNTFINSVDPDKMTYNEPSHL